MEEGVLKMRLAGQEEPRDLQATRVAASTSFPCHRSLRKVFADVNYGQHLLTVIHEQMGPTPREHGKWDNSITEWR